MGRKKAFLIILLLFAVSVVLRLPNIDRPLSRHHEFNTAVILVNIQSWRQGGGGARWHYVPLLNYQHAGDKCAEPTAQVDAQGNVVYVSFGPGWYVIPYFIYQIFGLPALPVYLQLINLGFHLFAVVMLFLLCDRVIGGRMRAGELWGGDGHAGTYESALAICTLFLFSPGVLWYLGNGYVLTGIELPFVFALLWVLTPMLRDPGRANVRALALVAVLIMSLVYIDWLVLFISAVMGIYLLTRVRREPVYWRLLLVVGIATVAGIALFLWQMASYMGWEKLMIALKGRFLMRSLSATHVSFWRQLVFLGQHMVSSYLPVLVVIGGAAALVMRGGVGVTGRGWKERMGMTMEQRRILKLSKEEKLLLTIYGSAVVLYNVTLLQWSAEHEFALLPLGLIPAWLGGRLLVTAISSGRALAVGLTGFVVIAAAQYYVINRPGAVSMQGTRYDMYQRIGKGLGGVPEDTKIFMDERWNAAIDVYSGRNVVVEKNIDSARVYIERYHVGKAVWAEVSGDTLERVVRLR